MNSQQRMLAALREDYAADRVTIEDYERRVARILRDDPAPVDALRDREAARNEYMIEAYKRGAMVFGA